MHKYKLLHSNYLERQFKIQEREINLAKKRVEDYNLSVSGDVTISLADTSIIKSDGENQGHDSSIEIILSAHCENDGWEEGYDY